jgi:uncharacterized membrane protein required for colicin V production
MMSNPDILFAILMLAFFVLGMIKGLLWTVVRLAAYAGLYLLISQTSMPLRDLAAGILHISPVPALIIVYIVLFVLMMILSHVVFLLLQSLVTSLKLGCLNRFAGGVFGLISSILLLSFLVVLLDISTFSLNGRNVRPKNYESDFSRFKRHVDDLMTIEESDVTALQSDAVKEALDKAQEKYKTARTVEEREQAQNELKKSMDKELNNADYKKVMKELERFNKDTASKKKKNVTLDSYILREWVEPLADILEIEVLDFEIK